MFFCNAASVSVVVVLCRFTTLEGLLTNIKEDLQSNPFLMGDSSKDDRRNVVEKLLDDLEKVTLYLLASGKLFFFIPTHC